ncbi:MULTISPECIES: helix-turn-helix domain-containing protein [unclassified Lactococcus]|uniref:MarR family transcriptional regulator n=1 Tax=unclassified Lactococcus TaxID=2643510 RepID=UPI0011C825E2|nr:MULTISPECIES: helix-turn-helix domain-containing protein [unclassified Lactococcus]MQW24090.1 MarR family transcriptional regulator [Lactococcus sp. dk101]TXK36572.1 MarR family transcriptional regulator [Lactococcus sp. dk310]TXK36578.1 MarR family transcriptional regulator [Lactococcus sp. dk310]TXK46407.1 MarR family transcriptional regulator [Lactococcus sp. dk322]TXK46413.1 MarR family transcriptional regulator [Lactococcus sp. dk322]
MSEKGFITIKDLSDSLGISKQRIQQIIAKLPTNKMPNKEGNKYILSPLDVFNIKENMGYGNDNKTTNRVVDYDIYVDLLNSSKEKDEQIKKLVDSQNEMQKLLDQQQQLQLKTQEMLEEKTLLLETEKRKKWWHFWN